MNKPVENILNKAQSGDIQFISSFLSKNEDPNLSDYLGKNLLMHSIFGEHKELSKLLISAGADINAKDNKGFSPLAYAVLLDKKEMVLFLLEQEAYIETKNIVEDTPLVMAFTLGNVEIASLLIEYGASTKVTNSQGMNLALIAESKDNDKALSQLLFDDNLIKSA